VSLRRQALLLKRKPAANAQPPAPLLKPSTQAVFKAAQRHVQGRLGWRSAVPDTPIDLNDWHLLRDFEELHECGGLRVIAEMVIELGAELMIRTEIDRLRRRYVRAFCPPKVRR
jgi:hypothetical protein